MKERVVRENHLASGRQGYGCNGVNSVRCFEATVVKPSLGTGMGTRVMTMNSFERKLERYSFVLYRQLQTVPYSLDTTFICRMYPRSDDYDSPCNRFCFWSIAQSLAERMFQLLVHTHGVCSVFRNDAHTYVAVHSKRFLGSREIEDCTLPE